ncbi:MAG: oligosaccharide flippase family protein [Bacteroidales bacterium]|nr:oligosaccharide flippase family protein [Bacteroidales bacterium]
MINLIKRLAKENNFLSLASNGLVAAFGVLGIIILTRSLSKDSFGEWILFLTGTSFIEMFRFGITKIAIIRFLSGAKDIERKKLIGSNWLIGLIATLIIVIIVWGLELFFAEKIDKSGFSLFFIWYPILSIINLPFNNALTILQADQKFDRMLFLSIFNTGGFIIFLTINYFFFRYGITTIVIANLLINLITSVICMIKKWDGISCIFHANKTTNKLILNFGKFTTGTLIGSNLLKSSDHIIIGLSPFLGTAGVALFAIPLKLIELIEVPLRSFVATAFPKISKASLDNDNEEVKSLFYTYSGAVTFLIFGIIVVCFIFAEQLVSILGGKEYLEAANIFRVFLIYGLLISVDKFTGVTLDSINKPKQNFYKVVFMALANIIGDLIAVFVLHAIFPQWEVTTILLFVASVTILTTLVGLFFGFRFLNKEIPIKIKYIFIYGWNFYRGLLKNFKL